MAVVNPIAYVSVTIALICSQLYAQTDIPVLRTNSRNVKIDDAGRPMRGDWIIDPSITLDVYEAYRSDSARRVTFTTDIGSQSFDVEPGRVYDFVILLNGKDACKTRISTMRRGPVRVAGATSNGPITIPITIERGKVHLRGSINSSKELDLIFDTGADACVLYPSGLSSGATLVFDGTSLNQGTGGTAMRRTSSDNRIEIGGARWTHESVMFIDKQADHADGIIGYSLFEDRIVEIDYDRMVLVLHESLPAHTAGFTKIPMPFAGSLPAVEIVMKSGDNVWRGPFILDTAGNGTMLVNQAFAAESGLHGILNKVGSGVSKGVGSGSVHTNQLMMPTLALAGHEMPNVPIYVEVPSEGNKAPPGGVICTDVLARFNSVLDFPSGQAYFKPNNRFSEPFKIRGGVPWPFVIAAIGGAAIVVTTVLLVHRAKTKRDVERSALAANAHG